MKSRAYSYSFQLTIQLGALVKEASMQSKLISIYTDFIADFEAKLDPLKLAQIGMVVVEKYASPEDAIAFVERIQDKVKMQNEALCLCKVSAYGFPSALRKHPHAFPCSRSCASPSCPR